MLRRCPFFALAPLALLAASGAGGCGDDDTATPLSVAWSACDPPFHTMDRCGTMQAPLNWDEPQGEKIAVYIAQIRARSRGRAQLWFLQGGPGASGAVFAERPDPETPSILERYHQVFPDFDIYVLEHRGVGLSTRLGCPAFEANGTEAGFSVSSGEMPLCIDALKAEWGERLRHFSSQAAARDLAAATDATREEGQSLFVYAASYGTYWALQYLRERPADASGVVLDSIAAPGVQFFNDLGLQTDGVAQKLSTLCAADAICAAKMGPDPWAKVAGVMAQVQKGEGCFAAVKAEGDRRAQDLSGDPTATGPFPDGATYAAAAKRFLRLTLQFRTLHPLFFPALYRLERCEPADAAAFYDYLFEVSGRLQQGDNDQIDRLESDLLRLHVGISELYDPAAPSREAIEQTCGEALFCSVPLDVVYHDTWPRYALPPNAWAWPATGVPILAMNGELDTQTPIEKAETIVANLLAPTQNFVRVPFATHTVMLNSPVKTADRATCGDQMIDAFLRDPAAAPASGCLADLVAPGFAGTRQLARDFFKQSDVWENDPELAAGRTPD